MLPEKEHQLLQELLDKTEAGKLKWRQDPGALTRRFQAHLRTYSVVLDQGALSSMLTGTIHLAIHDASGKELLRFAIPPDDAEYDAAMQLMGLVRSTTDEAERAIEGVLRELSGPV